MKAMDAIKKYWIPGAGVVIGSILGFLYWKFVGCSSGSCPITSKPLNSSIYGAVMGGLLFSMFNNNKRKSV